MLVVAVVEQPVVGQNVLLLRILLMMQLLHLRLPVVAVVVGLKRDTVNN